jgi:hypothetical protein
VVNSDLSIDKVRYELATAEVARQHARIAEIRTNAGIVIAAVSLVASFLGAKTIDLAHHVSGLSIAALAVLPLAIFAAGRAIWPPRDELGCLGDWALKRSKRIQRWTGFALVFRHEPPPKTLTKDESYESLAKKLREMVGENQKLINRRSRMLMTAIGVLWVDAVLWAIALGTVDP